MKAKSLFLQPVILLLLVAFISCKKTDTTPVSDSLALLNATWVNTAYGGVNNNTIKVSINSASGTGAVTAIGSQNFGIVVGDVFFTNLTAGASGNFNGMGEYTYGTNSSQKSTRAVVITLQNNNTQLTADYPAINASFPEIIYIFQKQ